MAARGARFAAPVPGDPGDVLGWRFLVEQHLLTMAMNGLSPATVYGRRKLLATFAAWCLDRDITTPTAVSVDVLDVYRRHLYRRQTRHGTALSLRSQQQHLIAIRGLFTWLTRQRHITSNPACELEIPQTPDRLPRTILTPEQAEAVLALPNLGTLLGLRDRVMLEVLYATGIRRSELAGLTVADINLTKRTLFVACGKGARDRIVPLGERATVWVNRYLTDARPTLTSNALDEATLFVTNAGTPICLAHAGRIIETYLRTAGIAEGGCHLFRHTLATLMLEGGADVRWVQAMLGHRSLVSTQIYTHVDITKLAAVHAATHPAAANLPRSAKKPGDGLAQVVELRHRVRD
jgi:integrase/recombinase XerD